ncbi:TRAP transporter small permease [Lutimaribacter sp. EGI FJ00015]|uniref:TRAP transporter small permease n=1 Tax=Lutimaribacter degradans TaxID=2945989 RepID=A0ACC5ZVA8_9RHOB|nr:TRAP transporter small permease [Lutimaribacter sp. EGI FJ00013]MCM2561681.1 TRAP transporter small permease [Lutimaribacter sp. EGI FJ00013]MCO0612606.1 TRAP transporter small permease [Lutimaribacter sp. EGI FJ00015]MCO0635265.1 TRAP transporter small permease [Lutimaribacter sp. EGI FJ00014]
MTGSAAKRIISNGLLGLAGFCFLFGAGVTVVDVALRAVAGSNVPAAIELTSLSIGLGALLSMPVCYAQRTHVTAKLLSELFPRWFAYPLGIVGAVASVVFAALLLWLSGSNALSRLGSPETTADLGLSKPLLLMVVAFALGVSLVAATAGLFFAMRTERNRV